MNYILTTKTENELYHYGVLGMKWGVRKNRVKSSGGKKKTSIKKTDKTATKPKIKTVKEMSDDEIRAKINRMQLEQQYMSMQPKHTSKGKTFIKRVANNVLVPAAEDIGRQLVKSLLTKEVNKYIKNDELKIHTNNKKK